MVGLMQKLKVSGCIVSYGGFEEVRDAIKSITKHTNGVDLKLYIVDNASPDKTGKKLANENFGDNVEILLQKENLGFGSGHNKILPVIESDYHVVINPDILLDTDAISALCQYMNEHPEIVMATPRLVFPSGEEQYTAKRLPTFTALLSRQLPLPFLKKTELHYQMRDEDLSVPREIQFCTGCFFVMKTEVFKKIGGFDEGYFMYVEDADITRKAQPHGKIMYLPITKVIHAWHRTPNKKLKHFYLQIASMFRYWKKWGFRLHKN